MAMLPDGTLYGFVEGSFGVAKPDGPDDDDYQDYEPAIGTVTFTPAFPQVFHEPTDTYIFMEPETIRLNADGKFKKRLVASDSPGLNPQGLYYKVKVSIAGHGDIVGDVIAKADTTIKFSKVVGTPPPPNAVINYVSYDDTELRQMVAETKDYVDSLPATGEQPALSLNNADLIDTTTAEVFNLTYTEKTVVSIATPGRTSFIAVIDGYSNITWDSVTVHGDADTSGLAWGTFVWDGKGWHLFVDSTSQQALSDSASTLPVLSLEDAQNLSSVANGIYRVEDSEVLTLLRAPYSKWSTYSGRTINDEDISELVKPKFPVQVVVENGAILDRNYIDVGGGNYQVKLGRSKTASPLASQGWVDNNYARLEVVDQGGGGARIPEYYLGAVGDMICRSANVGVTGKASPLSALGRDLGDYNYSYSIYSAEWIQGTPVTETDGEATPQQFLQSTPMIAYHTKLDKMVMWSPVSLSWRNMDGTAL